MKKIIGIYDCNFEKAAYDANPECLGGSETWTKELITRFVKNGEYYVILFCNTNTITFSENLEYYPCNMVGYRCSYTKFDVYISSRTITGIADNLVTDKLYVMCHDQYLVDLKYNITKLLADRVDKYCFVSTYQRDYLTKFYKENFNEVLPLEKCIVIGNGINPSLYEDVDKYAKKNQMVFSSRPERGLLCFLKNVFPIIKREVGDFKVKVCHYGGDDSRYREVSKYADVEIVGKLGKQELANMQKESKVWVYLYDDENYKNFRETFCITAVENGYAKNALFTINEGAIPEVLNGYEPFFDKTDYEKIAKNVISALQSEEYCKELADKAFDVSSQYSWDKVWQKWVDEINS